MIRLRYYLLFLYIIIMPWWIMEITHGDYVVLTELKNIKERWKYE
jgi:hypothetical protein